MADAQTITENSQIHIPRVVITYCTQCRWMLRAAYFGQELLSTFGTTLGEVALVPRTGGIFTVKLYYGSDARTATSVSSAIESPETTENHGASSTQGASIQEVLIWDRKAEGGFPETKVLKQRIRDHVEPNKDLGHSDIKDKQKEKDTKEVAGKKEECEDCK